MSTSEEMMPGTLSIHFEHDGYLLPWTIGFRYHQLREAFREFRDIAHNSSDGCVWHLKRDQKTIARITSSEATS